MEPPPVLAKRRRVAADVGHAAAVGRPGTGRLADGSSAAVAARATAPRTAELLPLWNHEPGPAALGAWSYVSFTPSETKGGLVLFLDFIFVFFVVVQRIGSLEDVERLLRWCAVAAVGMALFGIVQLLASNGKFFWVYQHPFAPTSDAAKGSFANRNHFAQFLALGIGPLLWWLQDVSRRGRSGADRLPAAGRRGDERKTYLLALALESSSSPRCCRFRAGELWRSSSRRSSPRLSAIGHPR